MRLIEIRLLEGPNVYRLEPVVKVEVAIGRRRSWYGRREPEAHALVRLGATVPAAAWPEPVAAMVAWTRRLRADHDEGGGPVAVHRSSDPGHWIVTWPWRGEGRAQAITEAAFALAAARGAPPARAASRAKGASPAPSRDSRLGRWHDRIAAADTAPPPWIRDAERRLPVISISGTNGKTTTTRLVSHILRAAGHHVGTTTSDGILIDEKLVEAGDWTGPVGAQDILRRSDIDLAVLETARGGIVLRGVGYESNEASILTNVTSDHLDLQGIHTLPELAEVKATICRMTRPDGRVILNADDRHVAAIGRRVRARVAFFSMAGDASPRVRRHLKRGGRAYLVRDGRLGEAEGPRWRPIARLSEVPITLGGIARHNVANALAAAGGARAMGASIAEVRQGLTSFQPSPGASPGRLNIFERDGQVVIVDFAHNEAGLEALLDVGRAIGPTAQLSAVVGTAGDRPDDTLRGMGRIAARRVDRLVIKETLQYLRGRTRQGVVGEIRAGARAGGWRREIPVYESETAALAGELDLARDAPGVLVLLCHEDRDGVFRLLEERGFSPLSTLDKVIAGTKNPSMPAPGRRRRPRGQRAR
ncbi:MAG TPA: Mur ligase family protein [Candidatus Eisenbacteria bacterium]|nr:Mur ligase family protein [Candidatus Eisenbacteria bacterium]